MWLITTNYILLLNTKKLLVFYTFPCQILSSRQKWNVNLKERKTHRREVPRSGGLQFPPKSSGTVWWQWLRTTLTASHVLSLELMTSKKRLGECFLKDTLKPVIVTECDENLILNLWKCFHTDLKTSHIMDSPTKNFETIQPFLNWKKQLCHGISLIGLSLSPRYLSF